MKGDFSRSTFAPQKHYSGVRMQQGRVQLDADWNENLDILRHRIETEAIDVIGACGVPVHDPGFGVVTDIHDLSQAEQDWLTQQAIPSLSGGDFYLTQGRAYVDGILLEYDHTLPVSRQPSGFPDGQILPTTAGIYLLYLDVWERHMTAIEDPAIREVALGGPDTATRSQVIWQAALAQVGDTGDTKACSEDLAPWSAASTGKLSAQTVPVQDPNDPCAVPLGAGYKRLENQLYRVEIHNGSGAQGGPTYKWSRDNGSVVVAISEFKVDNDPSKIRVTSLGRDDVLGLHKYDWIEILDDAAELAGKPGTLVKINDIESGNVLVLSGPVSGYSADGHPKARRWDSDGGSGSGLAMVSGYVDLEGGVQIQFDTSGTYRTGDYWLIPARTVPGQFGDIEWPRDAGGNAQPLSPLGILHHYCRVAILDLAADHTFTVLDDCRKKFPPLTELPSGGDACCSVSVGPNGDYPDIQSALQARPNDAADWTICIRPGLLTLTDSVTVDGATRLAIRGCEAQSSLVAPAGKPAFIFSNSSQTQLAELTIRASSSDGAIRIASCDASTIVRCQIFNVEPMADMKGPEGIGPAAGPAIVIDTCTRVEIRENDLVGMPAVQANGTDIAISQNTILGGGVQIIPPSQDVEIDDNTISDGIGPGIQLGGGQKTLTDYMAVYYPLQTDYKPDTGYEYARGFGSKTNVFQTAIRNVGISRNLIGRMDGSGIITDSSLVDQSALGDVEELRILDNAIVFCAATPDVILSSTAQVGGGIAAIGLFNTQIHRNVISGNGNGKQAACGIFVLDGSDVEIAGNMVAENGVSDNPDKPSFYQAGIAAHLMFGNFVSSGAAGDITSPLNGYPALRVCDNQVICPAGQALTVMAIGGVIIDGNSFSTRERQNQPAEPLNFGVHGACVSIVDLGVPAWNPYLMLQIQSLLTNQTTLHIEDYLSPNFALANLPDGRVLFHNNQIWFDTAVQETVQSLGVVDATFAQRAWNAATFSSLFVSLDDLSLSANQFQARVPPYLLALSQDYIQKGLDLGLYLAYLLKFIQVGALGSTIRAATNGLNETPYSNLISLDTVASTMNVTTGNEGTHAVVALAPAAKLVNANNLSLMP